MSLEEIIAFISSILAIIISALKIYQEIKTLLPSKHALPDDGFVPDVGKRLGRIVFFVGVFILAVGFIWILLGSFGSGPPIDSDEVLALFKSNIWVTYEPIDYVPGATTLDLMDIEEELTWIRNAGFTGIITFSSNGDLAEIPRIAHEHDLHVIMGIWSPGNTAEHLQAIGQKEFVDAYVV